MSNPVQPLNPLQSALVQSNAIHENRFIGSLRAIDATLNYMTGGLQDETWSARWARWALMNPKTDEEKMQHNFGVFACHALDLAQDDHGYRAILGDEAHAEEVVKTEQQAIQQAQQEGQ